MTAKNIDELKIGDTIISHHFKNGKRCFMSHTITQIFDDEIVVDDIYNLAPNEDEQYIVLPKFHNNVQ